MAGERTTSLHAKASRVVPDLGSKSSTIVVAVLRAEEDANHDLEPDDFLWVKCHAKISMQKIQQQYDMKRESKSPWVLKYDGKPVNLDLTVGVLNTFGNNVVVLEAENTPVNQAPASPYPPVKAGNPLSPKDPNPRLPPTAVPSKPTIPSNHDKNGVPTPNPTPEDIGLDPKRAPNTQHNPFPTYSPKPNRSPLPMPVPPHTLPLSTSHNAQHGGTSLVKVELGQFPEYCAAHIDRYRTVFPGETDDQLRRRLWSCWLQLGESERSMFRPSIGTASVKTEAIPSGDINPSPSRQTPATSIASPPPTSLTETNDQGQKHFQLSAMLKDATPQILESAVEASVKLLDTLRAPLADKMPSSPDAQHWIQSIDNLKKQAVKTKTVIGVVGNTGAGKSSVINAMLDEERLVPTNCMRACTAVVTEISYNYEEHPYCAEIEFITIDDWAKELKVLFQDLLDGEGNVSRECTNEDSDAGVAYAKIKAVYPQMTKDDIAHSSIDKMLKAVSHILGTSRYIKEEDSLVFYKKLQTFVDSKEKSTGKKDNKGKKQEKERGFWPLIRVVRLYVKSPALATGAVIVDLPGVHDANAARAAVAEGYMKQCTGLWIVAPINRAVDDKAAKSLLGESFKRQLKMDGGFSAVTFICSKTDDISISEAQDSLGLDEQMVPSWEELDRLTAEREALEKQLDELRETKDVYEDVANDVDEQIEVWETLQGSVNDGKVAYPPKAKSAGKKRKAASMEKSSKKNKKRKTASDQEDDSDFVERDTDDNDDSDDSEEAASNDENTQEGEALTEDQVTAKLQELKTTKKDARTQKRAIIEKMQDVREKIKEVGKAESKITSEMSALCIVGRNQYSKGAIQQDFAAGIKEIDQEIAAEEDEENFNPDTDIRDYDEVAKSLAVFCVSSRGYQKLQGRLRKDPPVPGFTTIEETEIPALQAHCEKLTETGRAANCRAFINKMSSLLNSLTIWASSDGTGANLTAEQKAREARYLKKGVEGLETRLEKATKACARELNDEFQDNIFDRYEAAVQAATFDSIHTASQWGAPVNRENRAAGGLYWATYKAICRRNGCFTNAQGLHDWNAQLTEPMIKLLAPGWEKVFTRRIQSVMNNFTKTVPSVLKKFHRDIEDRARQIGTGLASLSMLSQQISVYEQILKDLAASIKDEIVARQKDINREFVPVIERAMQPSYGWCQAEVGPGQYKRMKAHMTEHVEQSRQTMFQESVEEVQQQLKAMVHDVEETLADKTDEVFIQIKRDYRSVLGGEVPQGEVIPRVQRQVRKEIKKTIDGVERTISKAIGLDKEESADEGNEHWGIKNAPEEDGNEVEVSDEDLDVSGSRAIKHEATNVSPGLHSSASVVSDRGVDSAPLLLGIKRENDGSMQALAPEERSSVDGSHPDTVSDGSNEPDDSDHGDDDDDDDEEEEEEEEEEGEQEEEEEEEEEEENHDESQSDADEDAEDDF